MKKMKSSKTCPKSLQDLDRKIKQMKQQSKYPKYQPHFGIEEISTLLPTIGDLAEMAGVTTSDKILREIEGLLALFVALRHNRSYTSISATLFLYVRSHYSGSIAKEIILYVQEILDVNEAQSGDSTEQNPWVEMLKNTRDNWNLCKGNRLFGHFSKLFGLFVTLGLCRISDLTFSIKDYKLISPDMAIVHGDAQDIISAAMDTIVFFTENIYLAWKTTSLKPFLLGNTEASEMDVEYATLLKWWELARNGNLDKIEGITDCEFNRRLETMATKFKNMLPRLKGIDKSVIERKFMKLLEIINDFSLMKMNSGFRRAPFTIEFFGDSSQGKSTCCEQLSNALLASAGLSTEKGRKYMFDSSKKHWDGARSDMLEFKIDDHANVKSEFVENSPCDVIVKVCNNVPCVAPMADLANKGRVWVEPEILTVTTNVLGLDARTYSNCPYSIQRRMHIVVDVKVKPEFTRMVDGKAVGIDTDKVIEYYTVDGLYQPPLFDDIWNFTVLYPQKPTSLTSEGRYEVLEHKGVRMENLSMNELMNFSIEKFRVHRLNQKSLETAQDTRVSDYTLCGIDGCCQLKGHCIQHCMQAHFGVVDQTRRFIAELEQARALFQYCDWVQFVPNCVVRNNLFQKFFLLINGRELLTTYRERTTFMWCLLVMISALLLVVGYWYFVPFLFVYCLFRQVVLHRIIRDEYVQLLTDRNTVAPITRAFKRLVISNTCKMASVLGALYAMARVHKRWVKLQPHGSLRPETQEDVAKRDAESNVWATVVKRELPITEASKRMSPEMTQNLVEKNLVYGSVYHEDATRMVNALFLKSNVVVIPNHYFVNNCEEINVDFRKKHSKATGGTFACRLSKRASYLVPNTDLRICYATNGGSFKDLTRYFPEARLPQLPFKLFYRERDGDMLTMEGIAMPGIAETLCRFEGGHYKNLTANTFNGMCGATLISETNGSTILGFHLGGQAGRPVGCYGALFKGDIERAYEFLRGCEGVLLTGGAEKFEPQVLGVKVVTDAPLNKKSPLNWMPEKSQVEYLGSCPGYSKTTSMVTVTPISHIVSEVCDVPNIWGPPKMEPAWFGWQKCLENLAVPALPYEYYLLEAAVVDYKRTVIPLFRKDLWCNARPLTDHQNINGIPGCKFIDSIKLDTSIGFPLSGPKRRFVVEGETDVDTPVNRFFTDEIMSEIRRCEDSYKRGERAYPIAKACKKDEILAKEKCRIFYGNAISLTFLIRKYYLPILRVLQMNPLVSECAVGINCHGPEWDEFYRHATKFGMDRLFGGDYGKYDQKIPAQAILASMRILIDCAKECDYTPDDIFVMEAMAGDLVYALIAFNGDLIGLTEGTHISGNSLTVVINGICGSLNLRAFFYSKYPKDIQFQDAVAIMTYGDDNIGSVRTGFDSFNIKDCSKFLGEYGQIYTMPDKESELLPFLPAEEFEFLKRKSVFHPDLGHYVGALLDKSIFKSLHCFMREKNSPLTEESAAALNIDTALREWFNHGRSHFDMRQAQMVKVAKEAGLAHMCTGLETTYDERLFEWKEKYDPQSGVEVNLYKKAKKEISMACVARDQCILNPSIGEVDLLFTKLYKGVHHTLVLEIKHSCNAAARLKGRKQLTRLVSGLSIINANIAFLGVLLTPKGYEVVSISEEVGFWEDFKLPFIVFHETR